MANYIWEYNMRMKYEEEKFFPTALTDLVLLLTLLDRGEILYIWYRSCVTSYTSWTGGLLYIWYSDCDYTFVLQGDSWTLPWYRCWLFFCRADFVFFAGWTLIGFFCRADIDSFCCRAVDEEMDLVLQDLASIGRRATRLRGRTTGFNWSCWWRGWAIEKFEIRFDELIMLLKNLK